MTLPVLDVTQTTPAELLAAFREHGAVLASDPVVPASRCDTMLADVAALFAQPAAAKAALAIERSPHFRGHSRMHNERDHREQFHFGRERAAVAAPEAAPHWRLQGPNPWPVDAARAARVRNYSAMVEQVGVRLLAKLAHALELDSAVWLGDDPYLLAKAIAYHPQPHAHAERRGVAAHLDFSLLTLTLQDDVGGLATRRPDGTWAPVPTPRGAWLVNVGELLQYVTGNRLVATPHRVVNPSTRRTRCSVPVFVNPSLTTVLHRHAAPWPAAAEADEHVHAVLAVDAPPATLAFGPAEWRRKGENVWCAACVGTSATAPPRRG